MKRYNKSKVVKVVFFLTTVSCLLWAVAAAAGENAVLAQPQSDANNSKITIATDGRIQSISFKKDAELRDVLRFLGAKYNKNIVPSPKVEGVITVGSLYNVTFDEALNAILGDTFVWEEKGNVIEVFTREEKSRMSYKVFTLSYIAADEAKKLIAPILSSVGQIGISSPAQRGLPASGGTISQVSGGDTMAASDTLVVYDYPERIALAAEVIKNVDVRPKQVLIEATILSVQLSEGMEMGVDWNLLNNGVSLTGTAATADIKDNLGNLVERGTPATSPIGQIALDGAGTPIVGTPIETSGFAKASSDGLRLGIAARGVSAFITALEQVTDTTILANPKILAVNKQLGEVYIGTKIGYISQTTQTQTSTTQNVEFLKTGTTLQFRPYIGDDGYVRMDIHPKDSSGVLKPNNIPDESSTELATNIVVKDGETIVIGGLFRDVIVSARKQIPILGDLPLIGAAFRSTSDTVTRQEVIVLLTPHIVNQASETYSQARIDDIRLKREGAKEQLQWLDRARLAEDRYAEAVKFYLDGKKYLALTKVKEALDLRPTYLEALRLEEKLIKEVNPNASTQIESMMKQEVEQNDFKNWLRR